MNVRSVAFTLMVFVLSGSIGCATKTGNLSALERLQIYTKNKASSVVSKSKYLSGEEILNKIIGNTIESVTESKMYREYYNPNGTLKGHWGGVHFGGLWAVSGQVWCGEYTGTRKCYRFSLNDGKVDWHHLNGDISESATTLLPGDAT